MRSTERGEEVEEAGEWVLAVAIREAASATVELKGTCSCSKTLGDGGDSCWRRGRYFTVAMVVVNGVATSLQPIRVHCG